MLKQLESNTLENKNLAHIDEVNIPASSMDRTHFCYVIKPENYSPKANPYPVIYLLHGYSNSYKSWLKNTPSLSKLATEHNLVIVTPEGAYASWYLDSSVQEDSQYNTYINNDVRLYIEKNYNVSRDKKTRAIMGISMGGHGAFYLARQKPSLYGWVGSSAGVLDLLASSHLKSIEALLGHKLTPQSYEWREYSLSHNLNDLLELDSQIYIDCGDDDHLFSSNQFIRSNLLELNCAHTFSTSQGGHTWTYFSKAISEQINAFSRYIQEL